MLVCPFVFQEAAYNTAQPVLKEFHADELRLHEWLRAQTMQYKTQVLIVPPKGLNWLLSCMVAS